MTRIISFLTLFLLFSSTIISQSNEMNQLIEMTKREAISNGFTVLDSGGASINKDYGLEFEVYDFFPNNYYIIALVDDCYKCKVRIFIEDHITGKADYSIPDITYSGSIGVSGFLFKQTNNGKGRIVVLSDYSHYVYAYTMLLKKPL